MGHCLMQDGNIRMGEAIGDEHFSIDTQGGMDIIA